MVALLVAVAVSEMRRASPYGITLVKINVSKMVYKSP